MIWVPNQLIGGPIGGDVILLCNTEAFPVSINYWTKDDEDALMASAKYEILNTEKSYKVHMSLKIKNMESGDFGTYKCFARNSLGSTQGSIKLYGQYHHSSSFPDPLATVLSDSPFFIIIVGHGSWSLYLL